MKSYEEVTKDVMKRSEEIIKNKYRRRRRLMTAVSTSATCLVLAGALGLGAWISSHRGSDIVLSSSGDLPPLAVDDVITAFTGIIGNSQSAIAEYTSDGFDSTDFSEPVEVVSGNSCSNNPSDTIVTNMESFETCPWYENTTHSTSYSDSISPGMITCDWDETEHHHSQYEDEQNSHLPTMIFDYEGDNANINTDPKIPPQNGTVHITQALFDAIKRYGDLDEYGCCENKYIVVIDYYVNGRHINPTEELFERERVRLQKLLGDITGLSFEAIGRNSGETEYYDIHACLTKSQISNIGCIATDEDFGCVIYLRDNYYKINGILPINNP